METKRVRTFGPPHSWSELPEQYMLAVAVLVRLAPFWRVVPQ
jgi:hypothetical protein